ncbi:hypothetical protein BS614_07600 [Paenibacillus xylanexedens]|uniref:SNF2-related protein n=1 Tax=Paenibacillus xylanexedens TaxID=528191 RepID=UPI0009385D71|nr:SNF2-related protein [Paenibacillus xylanexedens]APO43886.1 hypothetical protein BS614_07600 [Paenibacillus xylanexedens]
MTNRIQYIVLQNIQMMERSKKRLLPLQFAIMEKVRHNGFAFVFDEVGCGKTIESGIVIWNSIMNGGNKILVVCPPNLVFNWYNELLVKFGLDFKIINGNKEAIDVYGPDSKELNELSNLCIVTYDSRDQINSNAAIDRIKTHNIDWDLIVLDEGHGSKNEASERYRALEQFRAKSVLFLSATPIKTSGDNFNQECNLVGKLLNQSIDLNDKTVDPLRSVSFSTDYPISRNFKEMMLNKQDFRNRKVIPIVYTVDDVTVQRIESTYSSIDLERKLGCIFNYSRAFASDEVYKRFIKHSYLESDLEVITQFDDKLAKLITVTDRILQEGVDNKIVIFAKHRLVIDYLRKALICRFGEDQIEAMHGKTYLPEERRNKIAMLDNKNSELSTKRILVISHEIGVVGINLSRFNHLINYELPDTPADLEQRFGRIDRVTNMEQFNELSLYYFEDTNKLFDTVYLYRLFRRFQNDVIPLLPSKNLLYSSTRYIQWLTELIQVYVRITSVKQIMQEDRERLMKLIRTKEDIDALTIEAAEEVLRNLFTRMGYGSGDNLSNKIRQFAEEENRAVVYGKDGTRLTYAVLKERIYTPAYASFAADIKRYDEGISILRQEISTLKSLDAVAAFLHRRIQRDKVSEDLVFGVVYNVWKVWRTAEDNRENCSLRELIEQFNRGA